ncbi:MAG: sialidase family protein [bacterium]
MSNIKNNIEIKALYENKDRYLSSPSITRLAPDKSLLLYHDAPFRNPAVKFDLKSSLGIMAAPSPDQPDLKTKRIVPRFKDSGSAPSAVKLTESKAFLTDNRYIVFNWMGEPEVPVMPFYDWVMLLRGGYGMVIDASGEKLRFGKPRRITSHHYPAVSCYDESIALNENTILCPVDYDSNCMRLQDRPWETIIMRTDDLGLTWRRHGAIHLEIDGSDIPRLHHPAVRRLPDGRMVCMLHSNDAEPIFYFCESEDGGENWTGVKSLGFVGSQHSLIVLADGRLMMTYSPLKEPYGVKYRISEDGGRTWPESSVVFIDDSSESEDCGHARGLLLDDGSVYIVYYTHKGKYRLIMGARVEV